MKIYRNLQAHKGDTFRELLSMWEESDIVKVLTAMIDFVG